jgi:hypothetical protein
MNERQGRIPPKNRIELLERIGRPFEPQQAQPQRIAGSHVVGNLRHGSPQELLGLAHAALQLEIEGRHIEDQRMLQAVRQSGFRHGGGLGMRAPLRSCMNRG